jgi:hypothetical protein
MKYFMIGGDKREYGPVEGELIKQWIREGRANADTFLRAENERDWKPLGAFAEFQTPSTPPPLPSGPPPLRTSVRSPVEEVNDVPVRVRHAFARAWHLVGEHFGTVASASLLVWLIFTAMMYFPCFGLLPMLFYGPLFGGLYMFFIKLIREGDASPGDMFTVTREAAMPLMLCGFISLLLVQISVLLCCLPSIYLQIAWLFSLPLVVDRRMDFWSAMELSRRVATRHWFKLFGLCVVAFLPFVVFYSYMFTRETGDLWPYLKQVQALFIDMFSTGVPKEAELKRVFEQINEVEGSYSTWALIRQVLFLISMPLGIGSLAFVYEDLFGRKK